MFAHISINHSIYFLAKYLKQKTSVWLKTLAQYCMLHEKI